MKPPFFRSSVLTVCLAMMAFCLAALAQAATLTVPAQYPTIQAAVDAAASGDTVLVAAGTYSGPGNRDIDFSGKSLVVTSQAGPSSTIIDCGGYKTTDGSGVHRGFYLHSGEISATISGFTVKNGYETYASGIQDSGYGGSIFNYNPSGGKLTLTNCIVSGNISAYGGGGGIYNYNGGTTTLTNCTVSGNISTYGGNGSSGGGIINVNSSGSTLTLTNCTVSGNTVAGNGIGGGIYNSNLSGTTTLNNCTISRNTAREGGGISDNTLGTVVLTSCTISRNTAGIGGGIFNYGSGTITLTNCTVSGNTAEATYSNSDAGDIYGEGGGIYNSGIFYSVILTLNNCTISGNTAKRGGGIFNSGNSNNTTTHKNGTISGNTGRDGGTATLTNCTISGNTAKRGGGIFNSDSGDSSNTSTVRNSIFYGDTGGEVVKGTGTASILFSDIQGGYSGTSNIDKDPLFVNASSGDLHLKTGSPCLGGGTSNGAPPTDLDGNPRPNPPSMGAHELVISTLDLLHK